MSIRVMLVDDSKTLRQSLMHLLAGSSDLIVVGDVENGVTAVELCETQKPQVVVMDVVMPGLSGIEATRQIVGRHPEIRVLALSIHANRGFVTEMLNAGASGYLLKEDAFEELAHAIRTVAAGQRYLSPQVKN